MWVLLVKRKPQWRVEVLSGGPKCLAVPLSVDLETVKLLPNNEIPKNTHSFKRCPVPAGLFVLGQLSNKTR